MISGVEKEGGFKEVLRWSVVAQPVSDRLVLEKTLVRYCAGCSTIGKKLVVWVPQSLMQEGVRELVTGWCPR